MTFFSSTVSKCSIPGCSGAHRIRRGIQMDFAYDDYFQTVSDDVFIGYQEELPIDPGFSETRELWRVYRYLAAVEAEGTRIGRN